MTLTVNAPGVLGNDSDPESAQLSAVLVGGPTHGALTLNLDGSFSYTPQAGYSGPDSFTYSASDGSLSSTIIKSMKRAMAGEYSRELSVKVFSGQCRLITLGFRQGGPAGYGLRRQLVDQLDRVLTPGRDDDGAMFL